MPKVKNLALPVLMAAAAFGAVPAHAEHGSRGWGNRGHGGEHYASFGLASQLKRDIWRLDERIERARDRRAISRREAASLKREVGMLERELMHFQRGGLTRWEARRIESGIAEVRRTIAYELADSRHDRDDRFGRRYDRDDYPARSR